MSNMYEHARSELEKAGWFKEDSFYGGMVGDAVLELMDTFEKQGHSGMSAGLVSGLFKSLCNHKISQN